VLARLSHPAKHIRELLPWHWAAAQAQTKIAASAIDGYRPLDAPLSIITVLKQAARRASPHAYVVTD